MPKQGKITFMAESINEKLHKIKFFKDKFLIFFIFILAFFASFALGALSCQSKSQMRLLHLKEKEPDFSDKSLFRLDFVLASKKGDKYYFLWCAGSQRIKKENLIFFKDAKEAEKAGYSLSKTCK